MTPAPGQIWREIDKRFIRYVRIERVGERYAVMRTVERGGKSDTEKWCLPARSRKTRAMLQRFGKAYEYVED